MGKAAPCFKSGHHTASCLQILEPPLLISLTLSFVGAVLQVVIDCSITSDLEYTRANPTFHHWRTESRRYGLAFQNSTDAFNFERGIHVAINSLIQQG